jgi:hypothetical protein
MQILIDSLKSFATAIANFLGAIFTSLKNLAMDIILWAYDQYLTVKDLAFNAIMSVYNGWNGLTLDTLYSALPPDVAWILWRLGVPDFISVITAALLVKMAIKAAEILAVV